MDFATRVAKIVARKTGLPAYVGWSGGLGVGQSVEEEAEVVRVAVGGVMGAVGERKGED